MKCPVCQAKLLPVDGDLFCLQCGDLVKNATENPEDAPKLEETADPVLRRAIADTLDSSVQFTVPEADEPSVIASVSGVEAVTAAEVAPETGPAIGVEPARAGGAEPAVAAEPAPAMGVVDGILAQAPAKPKSSFFSLHKVLVPARQPMAAAAGSAAVVPVAPPEAAAEAAGQVNASAAAATVAEPTMVVPGSPVAAKPMEQAQANNLLRAWGFSLAAASLVLAANIGVGVYYAERIYPGVKVANVAVGGWTFAQLHQKLEASLGQPKLAAAVGEQKIDLDLSSAGAMSLGAVEQDARAAGRYQYFPLAGLVTSWFQPPVTPSYQLSDEAVARAAQRLAAQVDRAPSDAVPMVVGTNVLLLAEKPGSKLDTAAAAAAIRAAYGHAGTVSVAPARVPAAVTAAAYAGDVAAAQAILGIAVSVSVRNVSYTPSPAQVAGWLVFGGAGKGVSVDPAGPAAFVRGIPGTFDRSAAVSGLLAALNAHQAAVVTPSTKRRSSNPAPASTLAALPLAKFSYCLDPASQTTDGFVTSVNSALGQGGGWTLGGRIQYVFTGTNCNFSLKIADAGGLGMLDAACVQQNSCRIHNDLAISSTDWAKTSAGWTGDLNSYRLDLVNHVIGQWLGFEHSPCGARSANKPVLSAPAVTLPSGCSPNWYAVPAELQDTKVLPGL